MEQITKRIISMYTEATPNPENLKFVLNRMLYARNSVDFQNRDEAMGFSPLAEKLFDFPFVKGGFISNNFITLGKKQDSDCNEIIPEVKSSLREYLAADNPVLNEDLLKEKRDVEASQIINSASDQEIIEKIKDLLAKYIQPAVEMDGGAIEFKSYQDGIVTVGMKGACSGCPSSTLTLKSGIEGMMKRMIPEVREVLSEAV